MDLTDREKQILQHLCRRNMAAYFFTNEDLAEPLDMTLEELTPIVEILCEKDLLSIISYDGPPNKIGPLVELTKSGKTIARMLLEGKDQEVQKQILDTHVIFPSAKGIPEPQPTQLPTQERQDAFLLAAAAAPLSSQFGAREVFDLKDIRGFDDIEKVQVLRALAGKGEVRIYNNELFGALLHPGRKRIAKIRAADFAKLSPEDQERWRQARENELLQQQNRLLLSCYDLALADASDWFGRTEAFISAGLENNQDGSKILEALEKAGWVKNVTDSSGMMTDLGRTKVKEIRRRPQAEKPEEDLLPPNFSEYELADEAKKILAWAVAKVGSKIEVQTYPDYLADRPAAQQYLRWQDIDVILSYAAKQKWIVRPRQSGSATFHNDGFPIIVMDAGVAVVNPAKESSPPNVSITTIYHGPVHGGQHQHGTVDSIQQKTSEVAPPTERKPGIIESVLAHPIISTVIAAIIIGVLAILIFRFFGINLLDPSTSRYSTTQP